MGSLDLVDRGRSQDQVIGVQDIHQTQARRGHQADGFQIASSAGQALIATSDDHGGLAVHREDVAIQERAGYQLMPEWGTKPANHYLPRRKTEIRIHPEDLERVDNPLKIDGQHPEQLRIRAGLNGVAVADGAQTAATFCVSTYVR